MIRGPFYELGVGSASRPLPFVLHSKIPEINSMSIPLTARACDACRVRRTKVKLHALDVLVNLLMR